MVDEDEEDELPAIEWDVHREGRAWTQEEFEVRADRLVELKFEISRGRLFWREETRRMVLGMLLENVGMDAAVRMGDPARWKAAIDTLLMEQTKP